MNDLRKVVIIGGDHHATLGVIHGLKQYDYGGEITVISETS
jgi:arginase family enzyme